MSLKRLKNKIKLLHLGKREGLMPPALQSVGLISGKRGGVDLGASSLASSKEEDSSVQKSYSKDFCIILLSVFSEQTTKTCTLDSLRVQGDSTHSF